MKKIFSLMLLFAFVLFAGTAMADSISPDTFSATIAVGESVTIDKTVTIDQDTSGAKLDVLFLFDTTGSMGGLISAAKTKASEILGGLATAYDDVAFAVATYEDFPVSPYGGSGDSPYEKIKDMTTSSLEADAAIQSLSLGYGNDGPESQLYALATAATDVSWRADSTKTIVWFGDYAGHDGDLEPSYPSDIGLSDTIAALTTAGITVHAVDLYRMDYTGQATAITDATGGLLTSGSVSSDNIVQVILDSIEFGFDEYGEVYLDIAGVPDGVTVEVSPISYTGDFSRESTEEFGFTVTITGGEAGVYTFPIYAKVDGGIVAIEYDTITVTGGASVPEPATMLLLGGGLLGLGVFRKKLK